MSCYCVAFEFPDVDLTECVIYSCLTENHAFTFARIRWYNGVINVALSMIFIVQFVYFKSKTTANNIKDSSWTELEQDIAENSIQKRAKTLPSAKTRTNG
ncbi:unnamed protein product [Bursaphelenchus okinawaensis]|uniref:Uncharacterized protein n=1 Tax=Bursaphelenchus okinawaensis TaxID=465554 RepID=A0A811LBF0_9BILA|nr:unnamed protein product [Bursaphelenchus okinawaensis]CAG9121227.1 unnamed protein product [Bursaphelenchus okinawaensis]